MKQNLADLITFAAATRPAAAFGTVKERYTLRESFAAAQAVADQLGRARLGRGKVAAYVGQTSASYLVAWMAGQIAGIQTAMINPTYPNELLREMLNDLVPDVIVWTSREPGDLTNYRVPQFDATQAANGELQQLREGVVSAAPAPRGGLDCRLADIAGYMHTSGTSGRPKFCALSHEYFLRLGASSQTHFASVHEIPCLLHCRCFTSTLSATGSSAH